MYKNILFDLDGTLTDPKEGITNSIIYALTKMGIEAPTNDDLLHFIGPPLADSFEADYGLIGDENLRAVSLYREYFKEQGMYENTPYPMIDIVLTALKQQGCRLFVATSKPTVFAKGILQHFNLDHFFEMIQGSELDGTMSHKAEIIQHVIETHQLNKAETIMIGDRKFDINGAHENQIDSIGVLYGYGSLEEIKAAKPTHIVATVDYLLEVLLK